MTKTKGKAAPHPAHPVETWHTIIRQGAAECIGHAGFVFISAGAAACSSRYTSPGTVQIGIAIAFGFTLTAFAFTFGHVSGAHLNPAVTIGRWAIRRHPLKKTIAYVGAHVVGAFFAAALLKALIPMQFSSAGASNHCYGANVLSVDVTIAQAFFIEFLLTMFLLIVVGAAADSEKSNTTLVPLAIGLCVMGCHMIAIPLTGTSINPTRSLASALAATNTPWCPTVWTNHWIFWVAPIMGGIIGSFIYEYAFLLNREGINTLQSMYRDMAQLVARKPQQQQQQHNDLESHDGESHDGGGNLESMYRKK